MTSSFDPGMVTQDPDLTMRLRTTLSRINPMMQRYYQLAHTPAADGSRLQEDCDQPLGEYPGVFASSTWGAGAGNMHAWLLILEAGYQPERGHYALARAGLEGAATVRWLMDPLLDGHERRERAARFQADDHRERRNWEDAWMLAHRMPASDRPQAFSARSHLADHLRDMCKGGYDAGGIPSMVERVAKYAGEAWSYRAMSAFAHGRPWSVVLTTLHESKADPSAPRTQLAKITANSMLTVMIAIRVVDTLEAALRELEAYKLGTRASSAGKGPPDGRSVG